MTDQNQQAAQIEHPVDLRQKLEDLEMPAEQASEVTGGGGGVPGRKTPKSFPGQGIRLW
jgi:hypothetical protein